MCVTPLASLTPISSTPSTAGTRNTFGSVMTGAPVAAELRRTPLTLILRTGVLASCCAKAPVLLADRLWAAFPMLAPSRGVPSSWSEGLDSGRTRPEPCTTNQYSVDVASVTGAVGLNV